MNTPTMPLPGGRAAKQPPKGLSTAPERNAPDSNVHPHYQGRNGPDIRTPRGPSRRYVVCEERNRRMTFLGIAPASSPEEAIATIRRYAMRGDDVRMDAKPLKVTKK